MQAIADMSRTLGWWAWLLSKTGIVSLLKAFAFITSPLFVIAFLMSLLVGAEAWEPLWWFFRESAPLFLQLTFWVMLPSILLALVAAIGRWCLTWWRIIPATSLPQMYRARRFLRRFAANILSFRITVTSNSSALGIVFSTVPSSTQKTLLTAVGLTSVARHLQ